MSAAQQVGALGVVSTGIPAGGYDGPQAEKIRQSRVAADFSGRDPELFRAYNALRREAKRVTAALADMRLRVAAAVGPGGIHDVDAFIEGKLVEEQTATALHGQALPVGHVPDYAYPEAEQAKIREQRRAELSKAAAEKTKK